MGVLACDRQGCENIMCDYYSYEHGYICHDCLSQLMDTQGSTTISQFMQTPKTHERATYPNAWGDYVESVFQERN
ncbi:hypothetical protein [Robertmurraya sp.]|uniref:hypothetical protein n=1 Tax=Robertmurraya sp. TaxID=2837525 RepID=UPI003703F2B6